MPVFERDDLRLHYTLHGEGFPILLLAPGGLRSAAELWERAPFDPRRELADGFRLIAMDQRNAGQSRGPISAADGWQTYRDDQLALLDHLQIERCHVLGMCIGGPFCLGLMQAAPDRIASGVLLQPIGFDANREAFYALFDGWAAERQSDHPQLGDADWQAFRGRLFDGDFVFNLDRDALRSITTPMLVLRGDDPYHPAAVSEAIADLAPHAELIPRWKTEPDLAPALDAIRRFLSAHS